MHDKCYVRLKEWAGGLRTYPAYAVCLVAMEIVGPKG